MSGLFKCCAGKGQESEEFPTEAEWQKQIRHVINSSGNMTTSLEQHMENAFSHMLWYYIVCKPEKDSKKYLSHAGNEEAYAYKKNGLSAVVTRYTETEDITGIDVEGLVRSVLESPNCTSADKVMISIQDLFRSMNVSARLIVVFKKDSEIKMGTNIKPEKRVDLIGSEFRAVVVGY